MENPNQKHLTLEDRNYIEQALNHGMTFKEIAKFLSKDPTTISKEIKKHRIRKEPNTFNGCGNICKNRFSCRRKNVCGRTVTFFVLNVGDVILIALNFKKIFVLL